MPCRHDSGGFGGDVGAIAESSGPSAALESGPAWPTEQADGQFRTYSVYSIPVRSCFEYNRRIRLAHMDRDHCERKLFAGKYFGAFQFRCGSHCLHVNRDELIRPERLWLIQLDYCGYER